MLSTRAYPGSRSAPGLNIGDSPVWGNERIRDSPATKRPHTASPAYGTAGTACCGPWRYRRRVKAPGEPRFTWLRHRSRPQQGQAPPRARWVAVVEAGVVAGAHADVLAESAHRHHQRRREMGGRAGPRWPVCRLDAGVQPQADDLEAFCAALLAEVAATG